MGRQDVVPYTRHTQPALVSSTSSSSSVVETDWTNRFIRDPAVSLVRVLSLLSSSCTKPTRSAQIGTECYTTLVYNLDLDDVRCLRYALSKTLGLGIVVGGSIVKVPQILKVVGAKSAKGLSLHSYILDTASLLLVVGYNYRSQFPFSTYGACSPSRERVEVVTRDEGENVFLLVQNMVIISLIVFLSHHPLRTPLAVISPLVPTGLLLLFSSPHHLPLDLVRTLFAFSIPLSLASKLPQIATNQRRRSTGQLSAFLVLNSLAGCLARVFTTATETGDRVMWWSFVGASALNAVLAAQMLAFWKSEDHVPRTGPLPSSSKDATVEATTKRVEQKQRVQPARTPAKQYVRKAD